MTSKKDETKRGASKINAEPVVMSCMDAIRAGIFVQRMTAQQQAFEALHGPMTAEEE